MNDEIPLFTEREQERVLEGEPIGKAPKKDTRQALKNLQIWVSMAPNILGLWGLQLGVYE